MIKPRLHFYTCFLEAKLIHVIHNTIFLSIVNDQLFSNICLKIVFGELFYLFTCVSAGTLCCDCDVSTYCPPATCVSLTVPEQSTMGRTTQPSLGGSAFCPAPGVSSLIAAAPLKQKRKTLVHLLK